EDLGVRHRLWVYSGRRGVHCWVCDDAVRKWSPALRAAAVEYLSLVKVGAVWGRNTLISPEPVGGGAPRRVNTFLEGQMGSWKGQWDPGRVNVLLEGPAQHREALQAEFPKKKDSVQRWELLRTRMDRTRTGARGAAQGPCYCDWEVMLQFCFPRLDINVSKGLGHLLKSPFSVHPKTGRVSVPLDLQKLDQFDPFSVPTIRFVSWGRGEGAPGGPQILPSTSCLCGSSLCQELDTASSDGEQEDGGETEPKRRARDYKRTSLAPFVRVFEQFVEGMEIARRGEKIRQSGEC
ncbi:PRI1 primase, partial [Sterrhoptilus dennistouni]|nr:PRI1 primase [Sterrhoptilus dennistouni]